MGWAVGGLDPQDPPPPLKSSPDSGAATSHDVIGRSVAGRCPAVPPSAVLLVLHASQDPVLTKNLRAAASDSTKDKTPQSRKKEKFLKNYSKAIWQLPIFSVRAYAHVLCSGLCVESFCCSGPPLS